MFDLLTAEEDAKASIQGWGLHYVYDLEAERWRVMTLGNPHAEAAGQFVINQARSGDALAQKALSLVMKSNQGKT